MAVKAKAEITLSRIIDIESVTRYYLLQSSTASAPSKPTANPPGGNWKTTEPSYTSGSTNTLYFVDLTVMTNGTFSYSAVSKSSSYEAAKEAWNKANNAQNSIDNLQVGGRNLILNSDVWELNGSVATGITKEVNDGVLKIVSASGNGNWCSFSRKNVIEDNLNEGDQFTFSIEIKSEDGTKPPAICFKSDMGYYSMKGTVSPEYSWIYYTGTWKKTNDIAFHFGWNTSIGTYYIRKIKLEKGNKPTDWTPAPEDMATSDAITAANTAMDELADQVDARITATETDIDTVNQVISNLIVDENGGSLMKQTTDGWVFSMAEIMGQVQQATDDLKTLEGNLDDQGGSIDALQNAVNALETLTSYVRITTEGDEPCIELGNHGSFKVRITNTSIDFMDGTSIPAYINSQSLKIDKAEVENELAFGKFAFKERDNGNMGLIWKG